MARRIQRFEIRAQLGEGASGAVFRAHDPQLERDVAIKVLHGTQRPSRTALSTVQTVDLRDDGTPPDRALHEARMMARLSHPNILPIYEVGLDEEAVFVVMEHVEGRDLRRWLETPRSAKEVTNVFVQAGSGLAAAHARGIVHRDFKPDNVLVGVDGRARVADFGLSRLAPRLAFARTDDRAGTPKYMAPELWDGGAASTSSDVYAFAVALLEARGIEADDASLPRLRAAGLRRRACRAVLAALARDPAARPSMASLVATLASPGRPPGIVLALAAAIVAAGTAVAIIAFTRPTVAPFACDPPQLFGGRWSEERARLATSLPADGTRIVRALDEHEAMLRATGAAACRAAARDEVTRAQLAARLHCLGRRRLELEALVAAAHEPEARELVGSVAVLFPASTCEAVRAEPLVALANLAPLYARKVRLPAPAETEIEDIRALATTAGRAGDRELEARILVSVSVAERDASRSDAALKTLDEVRRIALELDHHDLHATALVRQVYVLTDMGRLDEAARIGSQALALLEQPMRPLTRFRIGQAVGWVAMLRDDHALAMRVLRPALALAMELAISDEIDVRMSLIAVRLARYEPPAEIFRDALEAQVRARTYFPDGSAIDGTILSHLGWISARAGQLDVAVVYYRQAVAVMRKLFPEGSADVLLQRLYLASTLIDAGHASEALPELRALVDIMATNPATGREYGRAQIELARAQLDLGRMDAGLARYRRGLEEMLSRKGKDDVDYLYFRAVFARWLVEAGDRAGAASEAEALLEAYARAARPDDPRPDELRGQLLARIALVDGDPARAEELARLSLAALTASRSVRETIEDIALVHGEALVELGRVEEARTELDALLLRTSAASRDRETRALVALQLARAEIALGDRTSGRRHLALARPILAAFPNARRARQLAALAASR